MEAVIPEALLVRLHELPLMASKPIVSQLNIRAEATRIRAMADPYTPGNVTKAIPIVADSLVAIQEAVDVIVQRQREIIARLDKAGI